MIKQRLGLQAVTCCAIAWPLATAALADALPRDARARACWLEHTRERTRVHLNEPIVVDFANLRHGYAVRTPFRVDFSVRGMGVIPAGKLDPKAGHHHLLIDQPLPAVVTQPIPLSDKYRHFGKGQTGTVLDLAPGRHTLRLLFADYQHRPYFVYSPELTIDVTGPRSAQPVSIDAGCKAWYEDEVTRPRPPGQRAVIINLRSGEPVVSPFTVRFGADGYGIAPRGSGGPGLGHFMFDVFGTGGRPVRALDLGNGATQALLFLPPGGYLLRLRLLGQGRELVPPAEVAVQVVAQERD
ncbi:MAG: DUF4399 domain-containing protein [Burkholderiales bacterium]|nr:DUF4399 domain-containing protein [Burkholderiales bacterium]MDE1928001.1 DUF4399 domain-containing protein [Burkholderiales bacterium]MDE2161031.1 DUF4399 domain-containing protein [Burkholderiales bacterium]MDE2501693.1 DUF4399 domain-containing protein [Burkholderiales bacterium]